MITGFVFSSLAEANSLQESLTERLLSSQENPVPPGTNKWSEVFKHPGQDLWFIPYSVQLDSVLTPEETASLTEIDDSVWFPSTPSYL